MYGHETTYCDKFPVKCEAYPACKVRVPRDEQMDHANTCFQVREICTSLCGDSIRRKYMTLQADGSYTHDCISYLKNKAAMAKHKAKFLKELQIYQNDIHKVFCEDGQDCITCRGDKTLTNLPEKDVSHYQNRVKDSLNDALLNLANLSLRTGLVQKKGQSDLLDKAQTYLVKERFISNTFGLINVCDAIGH